MSNQNQTQFALPSIVEIERCQVAWDAPWEAIKDNTSVRFEAGTTLESDVWVFRVAAEREVVASAKTIDFIKLIHHPKINDFEGYKRRVKRMVWHYVHEMSNGSYRTLAVNSSNLISMLNALSTEVTYPPDAEDRCPDFVPLFKRIAKSELDRLVPVEKPMRNGVTLVNHIKDITNDVFGYEPQTYSEYSEARKKKIRAEKGLHQDANVTEAWSDQDLSTVLHVAQTYSKYLEMIEAAWRWHTDQWDEIDRTGEDTVGYYTKRNAGGRYKQKAESKKHLETSVADFWEKVVQPKHNVWIAEGVVEADGTLAIPFYGNSNTRYTNIAELRDLRALKTALTQIRFTCQLHFAFMTGMRPTEVYGLKADCHIPTEHEFEEHKFDLIKGRVFKNNSAHHGEERDWPYPRMAAPILEASLHAKTLQEEIQGKEKSSMLFERTTQMSAPFTRLLTEDYGCDHAAVEKPVLRTRATALSMIYRVSRDYLATQTLAGHESEISTTVGYVKSNLKNRDPRAAVTVQENRRLDAQASFYDVQFGRNILQAAGRADATSPQDQDVRRNYGRLVQKLGVLDEANQEQKEDLQRLINDAKTDDFLKVLKVVGELDDTLEEEVGKGVRRNAPGSYCMAQKGGADFKGACSTKSNSIDDTQCRPWCPYNFNDEVQREIRAKEAERLITRFLDKLIDDVEIKLGSAVQTLNQILKQVHGFQGVLEKFKADNRLLIIAQAIRNVEPDFEELLEDHHCRLTLKELENA